MTVASLAFPAVLTVAKDCPFIGPVAGALFIFYETCQEMQSNGEIMLTLLERVNYAVEWLNEAYPVLKDHVEGVRRISMHKLISGVLEGSSFLSKLKKRSEKTERYLLDFVFSGKDREALADCLQHINEALNDFRLDLASIRAIQEAEEKIKQTKKFVKKFLKPLSYQEKKDRLSTAYHPNSRCWVFDKVEKWLESSTPRADSSIFWLKAEAGMGKSVLAVELARRHQDILLGLICFSSVDPQENQLAVAIKTLAFQIFLKFPEIQEDFSEVHELAESESHNVVLLFKLLVLRPLKRILLRNYDISSLKYLIVIEALDECETGRGRKEFLRFIEGELCKELPNCVKIFITSRADKDVQRALSPFPSLEILEDSVNHLNDMNSFISASIADKLTSTLNSNIIVDLLMEKSQGKFLYLSFVLKELEKTPDLAMMPINDLVRKLQEFPNGIEDFYMKCLTSMSKFHSCKKFLEIILASMEPLSEEEMQLFMDVPSIEEYKTAVKVLFPLRKRNRDGKSKFYPFHITLCEWLKDSERNEEFFINHKNGSQQILVKLLSLLRIDLNENNFSPTFTLSSKVLQSATSTILGRYLVNYLCDHLDEAGYEYYSFMILTSLSWMQARVALSGDLKLLIKDYCKRLTKESRWMKAHVNSVKYLEEFSLILEFLRIITPVCTWNDRVKTSGSSTSSLEKELCTQISGRFQLVLDINSFEDKVIDGRKRDYCCRIKRLVHDAIKWIKVNGGNVILNSNMKQVGDTLLGSIDVTDVKQVLSFNSTVLICLTHDEIIFVDTNTYSEMDERIEFQLSHGERMVTMRVVDDFLIVATTSYLYIGIVDSVLWKYHVKRKIELSNIYNILVLENKELFVLTFNRSRYNTVYQYYCLSLSNLELKEINNDKRCKIAENLETSENHFVLSSQDLEMFYYLEESIQQKLKSNERWEIRTVHWTGQHYYMEYVIRPGTEIFVASSFSSFVIYSCTFKRDFFEEKELDATEKYNSRQYLHLSHFNCSLSSSSLISSEVITVNRMNNCIYVDDSLFEINELPYNGLMHSLTEEGKNLLTAFTNSSIHFYRLQVQKNKSTSQEHTSLSISPRLFKYQKRISKSSLPSSVPRLCNVSNSSNSILLLLGERFIISHTHDLKSLVVYDISNGKQLCVLETANPLHIKFPVCENVICCEESYSGCYLINVETGEKLRVSFEKEFGIVVHCFLIKSLTGFICFEKGCLAFAVLQDRPKLEIKFLFQEPLTDKVNQKCCFNSKHIFLFQSFPDFSNEKECLSSIDISRLIINDEVVQQSSVVLQPLYIFQRDESSRNEILVYKINSATNLPEFLEKTCPNSKNERTVENESLRTIIESFQLQEVKSLPFYSEESSFEKRFKPEFLLSPCPSYFSNVSRTSTGKSPFSYHQQLCDSPNSSAPCNSYQDILYSNNYSFYLVREYSS
jgi:hypothetical protein